ncbi:mRNA-capping enzyme subunit alpha [Gongronella butleri]|nr:mRNA-capping enzyme subunit alpha [Gongronella butleri]
MQHHTPVPDIPGIPVTDTTELRDRIARLLGLKKGYRFPGAQPISFGSQELVQLEKEDFFVAEKSDGVRCLALLSRGPNGRPEVFLFDRKNNFHVIYDMCFPIPQDPEFRKCHNDTIVDGELVFDKEDDGRMQLKFLLFDCLMVGGYSLLQRDLMKRLGYLKNDIIGPHHKMLQKKPHRKAQCPFMIEFKHQQKTYNLDNVFNLVMPNLRHGTDGLIFTSVGAHYNLGTTQKIIKWKPANENSVDFKVHLVFPPMGSIPGAYDTSKKPRIELLVWHGDTRYEFFSELGITDDEWHNSFGKNPRRFDGRIIECNYDKELQEKLGLISPWRFMRFRDDKTDGNHYTVVDRVLQSIDDGVTKEELIERTDVIRKAWNERNERTY